MTTLSAAAQPGNGAIEGGVDIPRLLEKGEYVAVLSILFVLALATEKISNIIKLHTVPDTAQTITKEGWFVDLIWSRWYRRHVDGADKLDTDALAKKFDKQKERVIQYTTILVGMVITAFVTNAFTIPGKFDPPKLLTVLIIGPFLSLGSKFFHDVLDIVLLAKRAKEQATTIAASSQNVGSPAVVGPETIQQIQQLALQRVEQVAADLGYKKDGHGFRVDIIHNTSHSSGYLIRVFVQTKMLPPGITLQDLTAALGSFVTVTLAGGDYKIPVVILPIAETEYL